MSFTFKGQGSWEGPDGERYRLAFMYEMRYPRELTTCSGCDLRFAFRVMNTSLLLDAAGFMIAFSFAGDDD